MEFSRTPTNYVEVDMYVVRLPIYIRGLITFFCSAKTMALIELHGRDIFFFFVILSKALERCNESTDILFKS